MVDDDPGKAGALPHRERASLVERAVERLAAKRGAVGEDTVAPASEAPSEVVAHQSPFTSIEDAPPEHETDVPGSAALPGDAVVEPQRRRRSSKRVDVDRASFAARGILAPDTKRNRTMEEFRLIKRVVLSRRWDVQAAPGNTIVVTSALPAEGKTTTAINLAMSIAAEEDVRVVLVDADFIKPDALRQLGVRAGKGLIDVLQNPGMDIGDVMLTTNIGKLSLIPAGQLHERCTELLASARMDSLIKELASRYEDRILIFDSPPILATTESVALASHMGQIVFVVQAGRTKRESVDSALELIGERPGLGLVLNRMTGGFGSTDFGSYYGAYYYGYGTNGEQAEKAPG